MKPSTITLLAGPLEVELSPSVGGAISRFEHRGPSGRTPLLRGSETPLRSVLDAASFPLVPFVNRIRGGCFEFRGSTIRLRPNMAGDASPLHGQGWQSEWTVESGGESDAVLRFVHQAEEWPWDYEARQIVSLEPDRLSLRLECTNLSTEPMPCGLGQHPYFNCGPETRIETRVTHAWTVDENVLPIEKVPAAGRFDLADRRICSQSLDNGFGGWGGIARLSDPSWPFALQLSSPDAAFFQIYSPEQGGIFVAEPVTHANAALNEAEERWPELGLQVLEPGESMKLDMVLSLLER